MDCPGGQATRQLYCWWLCAWKIASTLADTFFAMVRPGPLVTLQPFGPVLAAGVSPWWIGDDLALHTQPLKQLRGPVDGRHLVAEAEPLDAVGDDHDGRSSSVAPMMPIDYPAERTILNGQQRG